MNRLKHVYRYNEKLDFGKHKGRDLGWAIVNDTIYIRWCVSNIKWFDMSVRAKKELDEMPYESTMPEEIDSEFQFMDFFGNY